MRRPLLKTSLVILALGLTGGMLPARADEPGFSGYSVTASASPVQIDVYEPTIPVPVTPQLRLMLGYATVEADSSLSRGRASFLWPGDFMGEGFRTVIENFGLPPELAEPIAGDGYPLQVNSSHPSGPRHESDEPIPGTVMRTSATADRTVAREGYSSNCEVEPQGSGEGDRRPELPGLPGIVERSSGESGTEQSDEAGECQIPSRLAALVDVGGYIATSETTRSDGDVVTRSRAQLSDTRLLGGLITVSGVTATAVSGSDGAEGRSSGRASYGTLRVLGQEFSVGPGGVTAAGERVRLPGLPDDPAKLLDQLGVTITAPKPDRNVSGDKASSVSEGLIVDVDTAVLRDRLDTLPLDLLAELINQLPDQAGELKSLLGAALKFAPRFVIHLGTAGSAVDTVQGIDIPLPGPEVGGPSAAPPADIGTAGGDPPATGSTPAAASASAPASASGPPAPAVANAEPERASAGLPPLFSIPGALLFGALALAALAGTYLRKLGALALGGGATCPHGLRSGLPDLRKV
ncbi:MAG: hypothetical protein GEU97_08940 [Actinophytocola sp.]|nr:hypothetical protein [Actinophytocola sp.]